MNFQKCCTGKRLTFSNKPSTGTIGKQNKDHINVSSGCIHHLRSGDITVEKTINSPSASLAELNFQPEGDTSYIQTDKTIVIKSGNNTVTIKPDGEISILDKLSVGNIKAVDGKFSGDIEANNMSLLGDMEVGNLHTTNMNTDCIINAPTVQTINILTEAVVAKSATVCCGAYEIINAGRTNTGIVETPLISSIADLTLTVPPGFIINVPNIRYNIDATNNIVIGPAEIKFSKIFVATTNVSLRADITCDGVEIIIYNRSSVEIKINGTRYITSIAAHQAKKLVYIDIARQWIPI